jgi:hypothetical protein
VNTKIALSLVYVSLIITIQGFSQTIADTFYIHNYSVPDIYYSDGAPELPQTVLNHKQKFFPKYIYNQFNLPNCGQASGIYNCLSYEFNRLLDLEADSSNTLSPTHVFHFLSGGEGYFGVSTFDSWNIVKSQGTPTVSDFFEPEYSDYIETYRGVKWMNGYQNYYNGMKYRISDYFALDVKTEEDIKILMHYFNDHLDGSENGGTVIFYANSAFLSNDAAGVISANNDSLLTYPWAYRPVYDTLPGNPTHSMTIVGYYNNNYVDFNNDSLITDDIDINNDGIVDLHDNEKILWVCVNSHGDGTRSVFLLKFDTLLQLWKQQVFFPVPDIEYEPKLTLKINLNHPVRNNIKVSAGISTDIDSDYPEKIIDFPVFNFQGGFHCMTGVDSLSDTEFLEFGIDATDLLSQVNCNDFAKLFIIIENSGTFDGIIKELSVIDYNENSQQEYSIIDDEEILPNRNTSYYSTDIFLNAQRDDDILLIEDFDSFAIQSGDSFEYPIEILGGTHPYVFNILNTQEYIQETSSEYSYNEVDYPGTFYGYSRYKVFTGWPFKLGAQSFDTLYVTSTGAISFTDKPYIWKNRYPYEFVPEHVYDDAQLAVHSGRKRAKNNFSCFVTDSTVKVWMRGAGPMFYRSLLEFYQDGRIKISFDSIASDAYRTSGLRTFNKTYFSKLKPVILSDSVLSVTYYPVDVNTIFSVDSTGLIKMNPVSLPGKYETYVSVRDSLGQKATKRIIVEVIEGEELISNLYPNPMTSSSILEIISLNYSEAHIQIFNISGQIVFCKKVNIHPGLNGIEISSIEAGLKQGVYFLKLSKNHNTKTRKFIVL